MSEQSGLSTYKIGRLMNGQSTGNEIESLTKMCDFCFQVSISEMLDFEIEPYSHVWTKTEDVNGVKETIKLYREKT